MKTSYGIRHLDNFTRRISAVRMLVALFATMIACTAAKADTVKTYDVSGTFASGGTLSGQFTYDYSPYTGGVEPVIGNITADGVNFSLCPNEPGSCNLYDSFLGGTADGFEFVSSTGSLVELIWSGVDLGNPPNILTLLTNTVCIDCGTNGVPLWGGYFDNLVSGTAVDPPTVATPENSTLPLLLSGLLALGLFAAWQSRRGKLAGQQI